MVHRMSCGTAPGSHVSGFLTAAAAIPDRVRAPRSAGPFCRRIAEALDAAAARQATFRTGGRAVLLGDKIRLKEFYDGVFNVSSGNAGDRSG